MSDLNEMWERLAEHQPYADRRGYGDAWKTMCEQRTEEAAEAARAAAFLVASSPIEAAGGAWAAGAAAAEAKAAVAAWEIDTDDEAKAWAMAATERINKAENK